jgi:putative transposase
MARENFLWDAPRIHGELLMLGFSISQATVSRYLPAPVTLPLACHAIKANVR